VTNDRRICGLPLWAFIILVILGLVVITAAVVVPLQLVNLSKTRNDSSNANILARCRDSNPCRNGGENIANSGFCSCICTNGFIGASCETKGEDLSCTSFDFADQGGVEGIKNATVGSALPRLFTKSQAAYDIALDPSLLLGAFSKGNLSCTLQNALVSFNGRTEPTPTATRRRRRQLVTDTSLPVVPTLAGTPAPSVTASLEEALDQDVVDFARVGVLYLAQTEDIATAKSAREALDEEFRHGRDSGNVSTGDITFRLDDRSVVLDDGSVVGGG